MGNPLKICQIAVALPVYDTYTYQMPDDFLAAAKVGKRALVPFGNRQVTGYILGSAQGPPPDKLKAVAAILDDQPLFPSSMVPFFKWMADYYVHPVGEVIQAALPAGINIAEYRCYRLTPAGRKVLEDGGGDTFTQAVLARLAKGGCRIKALQGLREKPVRPSDLATMVNRQWVVAEKVISARRTRVKTERLASLVAEAPVPARLSAQRLAIIDALKTQGPLSTAALKAVVPTAAGLLRAMVRDGQVRWLQRPIWRDPLGAAITPDKPLQPTDEQAAALATMAGCLGKGFKTFLLAGVTGSGKTEVYLQLADQALERRMQVLVLVPEIALISQIERRFRARFGERIAVLHSGLSAGERYDQWRRIAAGQLPVVVGARSALFAPLDRLGLIIVDEEHDPSYKQDSAFRYNARDLAVVRARQNGALAVLGSATPSVQTRFNAIAGKYTQLTLARRVAKRAMPEVQIVDLTTLRDQTGVRRFFSPALIQAMGDALERGEQVLLFLNRRGFATTLVCSDCGEPLRCVNCDISLTLHRQSNACRCHYCGYSRAAAAPCPACGQRRIRQLGFGTEKVHAAASQLFPRARVARMDRDTTRHKGAMIRLLKALHKREIDILVGTQMVAKGHDFPFITLVGILCADLSLSMPDFRAGERTFQLLAQVAGRAGRGERAGKVVLQTFNPGHFCITAARQQDFNRFYDQEITFRQALRYPPFSRMIQILVSGTDKAATTEAARCLGQVCRQMLNRSPGQWNQVDCLGPLEAPLARIARRYRWQMLLKGPHYETLRRLVVMLLEAADRDRRLRRVSLAVDVDPVFLM